MTYQNPPVIEVSYGVRYSPLKILGAHHGLFWAACGGEYDQVLERPPVFDAPEAGATLDIDVLGRRTWLIHRSQTYVLQLQNDRFYWNWRKVVEDTSYPGYDALKPLFERQLDLWMDFLEKRELGAPTGIRGILSYTNHVIVDDVSDAWQYFTPLAQPGQRLSEAARVSGIGWSSISVHELFRVVTEIKTFQRPKESDRILQLEVRVEATKPHADRAELSDWYDDAHAQVIREFENLTTTDAKKHWI